MRFDESAFDGSNLLWGSVTELIDSNAIKDLASEVGLQIVEGPLENLSDDEMISLGDDADTESDSEPEVIGESDDVPDSVSNSDDDVNARPQGYVANPQQCSLLNTTVPPCAGAKTVTYIHNRYISVTNFMIGL